MNEEKIRKNKAETIIILLKSVINNKITVKNALTAWPDIDLELDELIRRAWHELYHFHMDADIRSKDSDYEKYQHDLLNNYISDISSRYSV
jgi:hypothetical protein